MKSIPLFLFCTPIAAMANGNLENPQPGTIQSGISIISGWHCTANEITVLVDGVELGGTGVGSVRKDTVPVCGHDRTGFALLYNYNIPQPGEHTIEVFADGTLIEERTFRTVRSGGVPFLEGVASSIEAIDFPVANQMTRLQWSQAKQSFEVVDVSLVDQSAIVHSLNRSFEGTTYNISLFGTDSTSYRFTLGEGSLRLERSAFFSGTCIYEGTYEIRGAAIQSKGTYKCSDFSKGDYEAENLSINSVGLYSGIFYRKPDDSSVIIGEIHSGW